MHDCSRMLTNPCDAASQASRLYCLTFPSSHLTKIPCPYPQVPSQRPLDCPCHQTKTCISPCQLSPAQRQTLLNMFPITLIEQSMFLHLLTDGPSTNTIYALALHAWLQPLVKYLSIPQCINTIAWPRWRGSDHWGDHGPFSLLLSYVISLSLIWSALIWCHLLSTAKAITILYISFPLWCLTPFKTNSMTMCTSPAVIQLTIVYLPPLCCVYFAIFWCWGVALALILWQNDTPQPLLLI